MGGLSIFLLSPGNRFKREGYCALSWVTNRQSGAATGDLPIYRLIDALATPACDGKRRGLGQRQIARGCGIGLSTAHDYLERAVAAGIAGRCPKDSVKRMETLGTGP